MQCMSTLLPAFARSCHKNVSVLCMQRMVKGHHDIFFSWQGIWRLAKLWSCYASGLAWHIPRVTATAVSNGGLHFSCGCCQGDAGGTRTGSQCPAQHPIIRCSWLAGWQQVMAEACSITAKLEVKMDTGIIPYLLTFESSVFFLNNVSGIRTHQIQRDRGHDVVIQIVPAKEQEWHRQINTERQATGNSITTQERMQSINRKGLLQARCWDASLMHRDALTWRWGSQCQRQCSRWRLWRPAAQRLSCPGRQHRLQRPPACPAHNMIAIIRKFISLPPEICIIGDTRFFRNERVQKQ